MSDRPHLILIPGMLCDAALFAGSLGQLPALVTVADVARSTSIEAMADDVLAQAPDRFMVAGVSLGGIVAAEIATRHSDRIQGLGLLDTNLNAPSAAQIATRKRWASEVRSGLFSKIVADELVAPLTADPDRHGATIFDMAMRVGSACFLNQNLALMNRSDRRPVLDSIDVPVLIACGEHDSVTPPAIHDDMAQRCPSAMNVRVPDAGHLATIDQPEELNRVLLNWTQTCINNEQVQEGQENEKNLV